MHQCTVLYIVIMAIRLVQSVGASSVSVWCVINEDDESHLIVREEQGRGWMAGWMEL